MGEWYEQGWNDGIEGHRMFYPQVETLKRVCMLVQAESGQNSEAWEEKAGKFSQFQLVGILF